jgi:hypothetical protein
LRRKAKQVKCSKVHLGIGLQAADVVSGHDGLDDPVAE